MINNFKPKSEFSRNVLTLMTGSAIAQAIPIAITPILTRLYTPEDFGLLALYMSAASLVSVLATGRYELAIMLPKKDTDALHIVFLSLWITLGMTLLASVILFFFNGAIANFLGDATLASWLYMIPLSIFLSGLYQSVNYWNNRKKQYRRLAVNKIIQSSSTATLHLGLGNIGGGGLILGTVAGQALAASVLGKQTWSSTRRLVPAVTKLKMLALLRKYRKLPLLNLPNVFIDNIRTAGINILIAKFFTGAVLGQFALAWKMVQAPMSLIGRSLSQVFFERLATAPQSELASIIRIFLLKAAVISLPMFLLIYLFAEPLFIVVFGEQWALAGQAASIMSPWLFFNFLTSPVATVFVILNRQEVVLGFAVVYMVIPLLLLTLFQHLDFTLLLTLLSITMSLLLLVFVAIVFHTIAHTQKAAQT